jgi:hypothetical protein
MTNNLGIKILAPTFLAGAVAAATISFAPVAGATDSADCSDRGTSSVCTRTGHSSIYVEPRNDLHTFSIGQGASPLLAID